MNSSHYPWSLLLDGNTVVTGRSEDALLLLLLFLIRVDNF